MECISGLINYFFSEPPPKQEKILNEDVLKEIFKNLSPKKLAEICRVSKQFNRVISDENLWNTFDLEEHFQSVFLGKSWEKYFSIEVEKFKIDKRFIFKTLYSPCPFSNKRIYETHFLILMPEGMSLNKLLSQPAFSEFNICHPCAKETILQRFGKRELADNYLTLITKTILKGTREELEDKKCLEVIQKNNYEIPDMLSVIASQKMRWLSSHDANKQLYKVDLGNSENDKYHFHRIIRNIFSHLGYTGGFGSSAASEVFTLCEEEFMVGGTSPKDFYLFPFKKDDLDNKEIGISPMKIIARDQNISLPKPPRENILIDDVLKEIFKNFSPKKLAEICRVSKQFNRVISDENLWNVFDLEEYFPCVFLEKSWEKYLSIKVGKCEINKRLIFKTLYSPCPFSHKKIYETHSLTLIPKGMSLNKLLSHPVFSQLNRCYPYAKQCILQKFGEKEVADNYLALITKTILEGTRGKLRDREKCLEIIRKDNYEMPDLLSIIASHKMRSLSPHEENKRKYKVDLGNMEKDKYHFLRKIRNFLKNIDLLSFSGNTADFKINLLFEVSTLCKEEFRVGGKSPKDFYLFPFKKLYWDDERIGISPMKFIELNH